MLDCRPSKKVSLYGIVTKRLNGRIDIKALNLMENLSCDFLGCLRSIFKEMTIKQTNI